MGECQDVGVLRGLVEEYLEICSDPIQEERRELWRGKNSLEPVRPLIYVRAFAWREMPESECRCEDPLYRRYEDQLRRGIFHAGLGDDFIFEPWLTVHAVHTCTGWGVSGERRYSGKPGGSWKYDYPLRERSDLEKLREPRHAIDEDATMRRAEKLRRAVGDLITINLDRGPAYRMWSADISTDLGYLRGIEHFMVDMIENPQWLHELLSFLRDGILRTHERAEREGDWGLCAHQNQAMPYSRELSDPEPNVNGVKRDELWWYMAAQEMTAVSPEMHHEFMLRYQLPILAEFGLTAYGCCEDLTHKIDMLRCIPNLRRIAVAPAADVRSCAEQIGRDYVLSYRPSPADNMVSYSGDPGHMRDLLREDLEHLTDSLVDITLKDVETVQGDRDRVATWVTVVGELIAELY